jgi:hypothetical protein
VTRAVEVVIRGVEVPDEVLPVEDKYFFARSLAKFKTRAILFYY